MLVKSRGGVFMPVDMAERYDADKAADEAIVRRLIPDALILEATHGQFVFELYIDGIRFVGQIGRENDGRGWGYRGA